MEAENTPGQMDHPVHQDFPADRHPTTKNGSTMLQDPTSEGNLEADGMHGQKDTVALQNSPTKSSASMPDRTQIRKSARTARKSYKKFF